METTLSHARQTAQRLYYTPTTASAFAAKSPTTTEPAAAITAGVARAGGTKMLTMFIAVGADNVTGKARLWGWNKISYPTTNPTALWVPVLLETLIDFTASARVGVASAAVVATERFADTVTKTTGRSASEAISNAADSVAALICSVEGFDYIEWEIHNNSSATSVAAAVRFF